MSETKLTKARRAALVEIVKENDRGRKAHKSHTRANASTLEWLRKSGFIISFGPFDFTFHAIEATDAGRAAIAKPTPSPEGSAS